MADLVAELLSAMLEAVIAARIVDRLTGVVLFAAGACFAALAGWIAYLSLAQGAPPQVGLAVLLFGGLAYVCVKVGRKGFAASPSPPPRPNR